MSTALAYALAAAVANLIGGLLITTAVVGTGKIERALELARRAPDTIFIVESEQNVRELSEAAGRFPGVEVNLAVDLLAAKIDPRVSLA